MGIKITSIKRQSFLYELTIICFLTHATVDCRHKAECTFLATNYLIQFGMEIANKVMDLNQTKKKKKRKEINNFPEYIIKSSFFLKLINNTIYIHQ